MPLDGMVKITSTIVIDGHEYVVVTIDTKASITGRSVVIVAVDQNTAEQEQKRSIERNSVMDAQTSVLRTVARMIEDAADKGGPFNLGGM